jgi:hypothetical protein
MFYSTTDVYTIKRETVNFSKSLVPRENKGRKEICHPSHLWNAKVGERCFKRYRRGLK